jgi:hypothetical protein
MLTARPFVAIPPVLSIVVVLKGLPLWSSSGMANLVEGKCPNSQYILKKFFRLPMGTLRAK